MFLLSYKQGVEFEKARTAALFLQLAPFNFYSACMYKIHSFEGFFLVMQSHILL